MPQISEKTGQEETSDLLLYLPICRLTYYRPLTCTLPRLDSWFVVVQPVETLRYLNNCGHIDLPSCTSSADSFIIIDDAVSVQVEVSHNAEDTSPQGEYAEKLQNLISGGIYFLSLTFRCKLLNCRIINKVGGDFIFYC